MQLPHVVVLLCTKKKESVSSSCTRNPSKHEIIDKSKLFLCFCIRYQAKQLQRVLSFILHHSQHQRHSFSIMSSTPKQLPKKHQVKNVPQVNASDQSKFEPHGSQRSEGMSDMVLLQKFQRQQQNVADLMKTLTLLKREEELGQESSKGLIKSLLELKDLNKALATAAHQRRQSDKKQFGTIQEQLAQKLAATSSELQRQTNETKRLGEFSEQAQMRITALEQELQAIRQVASQLQSAGQAAMRDLAESVEAHKNLSAEYMELKQQYEAVKVEKDRLSQRLVGVTNQMAAVAGSQIAQMQGDGSTSDDSDVTDNRNVDPRTWSVSSIGAWLDSCNLTEYVVVFAQNSVDGDMLFDLVEDDLDELGIEKKADRQKLMRERERLLNKWKSQRTKAKKGKQNRIRGVTSEKKPRSKLRGRRRQQ